MRELLNTPSRTCLDAVGSPPAVTRTDTTISYGARGRGGLTEWLGLLPLTVPEVRRLLVALVWTAPVQPGSVLAWSRWRRGHQA
jgi:hypothetical protein